MVTNCRISALHIPLACYPPTTCPHSLLNFGSFASISKHSGGRRSDCHHRYARPRLHKPPAIHLTTHHPTYFSALLLSSHLRMHDVQCDTILHPRELR
ncbi:hypothetical protein BDN71DRAFT_239570 [Pleurotus eryngii]|uniref:Uncharacterized protein n=1 Tax=Pleurotus eryngii TaxID=5323 RepID=A0A9P5ZL27_PLEER|nr:hypothetical protein BDN71DRAFT_239570 [Pleurotus eryngii]